VLCIVSKLSGHCVFSIHFALAVFDVPIIITDCIFSTYTSLWASHSPQLCMCVGMCVCVRACVRVRVCGVGRTHMHACALGVCIP
jgi:hypothetical protein